MSEIKKYLYEGEISYEDSGMEEYELELHYQNLKKLYKKLKTKEEILEFYRPLWEENWYEI